MPCVEISTTSSPVYELGALKIVSTHFSIKPLSKGNLIIDTWFLRLWFVDNCDPYKDKDLPPAPEELIVELSSRYIYLYETITGGVFPFPDKEKAIQKRINENLKEYLK